MTHAPPTTPGNAPPAPTPHPLHVEWVSEGFEGIDMLAWLSARQKLKAPMGKTRAYSHLAFNLVFMVFGLLCLLVGILMHKPLITVLAVLMLLFCAFGLLSLLRLLNPAMFQARVIKLARKSDAIESTAGRWSCDIGDGAIRFEWLDRGHFTRTPASEITEVAIANDRVALLAGKFMRGFFPASALPPGDPEALVWSALRHAAPTAEHA
ncbi:MAG: hypothetical protein ACIARR_05535 [Phycisphaerales bacterium JB059]